MYNFVHVVSVLVFNILHVCTMLRTLTASGGVLNADIYFFWNNFSYHYY